MRKFETVRFNTLTKTSVHKQVVKTPWSSICEQHPTDYLSASGWTSESQKIDCKHVGAESCEGRAAVPVLLFSTDRRRE